jgi:hypothetical protein
VAHQHQQEQQQLEQQQQQQQQELRPPAWGPSTLMPRIPSDSTTSLAGLGSFDEEAFAALAPDCDDGGDDGTGDGAEGVCAHGSNRPAWNVPVLDEEVLDSLFVEAWGEM